LSESTEAPASNIRIQCVVIDSHEPAALARFWADVLGWRVTEENDIESVVEPSEGSNEADVAPDLLFLKVPDEKTTKNRLHLDLRPKDQAAEVGRILALGARHADIGQGDDVSWVVLADPEGNEFCVLAPLPPT
jgi:predicted enzyme related to lactoylglutathione lyase